MSEVRNSKRVASKNVQNIESLLNESSKEAETVADSDYTHIARNDYNYCMKLYIFILS
jgi:hypothetical protein